MAEVQSLNDWLKLSNHVPVRCIPGKEDACVAKARALDREVNGDWGDTVLGTVSTVADTAAELAKGVGDTAVALFNFPRDVFNYVTGTDQHFGQARSWSHFGEALTWTDNPITRLADTANGMVWGAADLLSGHTLNTVANEWLGLGIPYFSPPPTDARGFGRDIAMIGFIAAIPAAKGVVRDAFGLRPKTAPVWETEVAKAAEIGRKIVANRRLNAKIRPALASEAGYVLVPARILKAVDFVMDRFPIFGRKAKLARLVKSIGHDPAAEVKILRLVETRPDLFSRELIYTIDRILRHKRMKGKSWEITDPYELILQKLAKARPDEFPKDVEIPSEYHIRRGIEYQRKYYYSRDNVREVEYEYGRAIELEAGNAKPFFHRGKMWESMGKRNMALTDYSRAIIREPDHAEALYRRGMLGRDAPSSRIMRDLGIDAVYDLSRAYELGHIEAYDALVKYIEGCIASRDVVVPRQILDRLIDLNPEDARPYRIRANFILDIAKSSRNETKGRMLELLEEAAKDLERALEINSERVLEFNYSWKILEEIAQINRELGKE